MIEHPDMQFIDLQAQYKAYQAEIDARMRTVLSHGQFIMGPEIAELESVLGDYVGVKHCITTGSGTASLEIALRALNIGAGDEVITVPFTWISTAEAVCLVGATPIFVDITKSDYNIDVDLVEQAITPQTRAIIAVSLFGQMPDYDRLNDIARKYDIAVIEDGAQSFGATQHGKRSCGVTRIGCTSFFPSKPPGCFGDGGAVFTNDDALATKIRAIRSHGRLQRNDHHYVGTNGRLDTLQAAVILGKFPHFEWEVLQRSRIGARYSELLRSACDVPEIMPGNTHVYAQYTIRVSDRDCLSTRLRAQGIPTGVYYPKCLHQQPVFANGGRRWGDFPVAEQASREVISLPMHPFLTEDGQDRIIRAVKDALGQL